MKLNLVPTYVNEGKKTRGAVVLSVLIAVAGIAGAVFMKSSSESELNELKNRDQEVRPQAQAAVDESLYADQVIAGARSVILNINLADAMKKHSTVYPNLYDELIRFIPGYYRLSSMSAVPAGEAGCNITLVGSLQTQQQYADLMLAMRRIEGIANLTRQGFQEDAYFVPGLVEADQTGRPRRRSEGVIPDNPLERLDYFIAQGSASGFDATGGFGNDDGQAKGAMPGWHTVTLTFSMPRNIMTPDPRASLAAGAAGAPPAGGQNTGFGGAPPAGGGGGGRGGRGGGTAGEDR